MVKVRYEEQIKNHALDKFSKDKIVSTRRKIKTFIKIYNKICPDCRYKVLHKPEMELEDYCKTCQDMINELGGE